MKALILAGGFAVRLYPLTENFPKPLLKIKDKPIIEYLLEKISKIKEIDEIYIVTNKKFYQHFKTWNENFNFSKKIEIINDNTLTNEDRLGSIGDTDFVIKQKKINDDLLVLGGDNLFEFDLKELISYFYQKNSDITALYDLQDLELIKKMSVVEINEKEKIIYFEEKPSSPKTTLMSICCYLYKKETLHLFDEYLKNNKADPPGNFIQWLYKIKPVYGFKFSGKWFDIGSFESLEKAKKEF